MIIILERINRVLGKTVSVLSFVLILVIILDVCLRYFFSITSAASFELEWHLFAALFLLSAGWAFQEDRHVRVDVFYHQFSAEKKAWVDFIGCLVLLLPLCLVGTIAGIRFTANSWLLREASPDAGGLPARYLIKSAIPLGFVMLGLQALATMLRSLKTIIAHG